MSKLAFTFALAAVVAAATALARAPTRTVRAAPTADVQATARPSSRWSRPAKLSNCAANPAAHVVFPSDSPTHATGQGAIVWNASSACPGGEGARLSPLSPTDLPGATLIPRTSHGRVIAPRGELVASGAPGGEIVLAGASRMGPVHGLVIQGAARGPFSELHSPAGSGDPMALTTAYLGDVALASAPAGLGNETGLNVHVERFFAQSFDRNVSVRAPGAGPMHELTLAMDFRSEALAVWEQDGAIYARLVPNGGRVRPLQRLAYVGSHPRIAAVISDDNRAIVAWSEQHGTQTSVYVDRSALGVRFGAPQLLERFRDPDGLASPAGSPRLVRLSSESVLLAWAGVAAGHWVVRTAPVDLHGVLNVATIAAPGADALLADLAPGPDDEALVLWTEPLQSLSGLPDMGHQTIFAARGSEAGAEHVIFDEPEQIAAPGPVKDATVAIDPDSGRAVAAWQGEGASIEYSIRSSAP